MTQPTEPTIAEQALKSSRDEFVNAHPFPLLVGGGMVVTPMKPGRTGILGQWDDDSTFTEQEGAHGGSAVPVPEASLPLVLAVRKVQPAFPNMITLGRTSNNDMVLRDVTISRFHAFFRMTGVKIELGDAGSRNGTWVRGTRLVPKGPTAQVGIGDGVRLGGLSFSLLEAGACWDVLQKQKKR
jgi:hypothetical protein